jgi:hypothetical protein
MSGSEETFPPDPRLIQQTTKPGRVFCTVPSDNEKDIGKKKSTYPCTVGFVILRYSYLTTLLLVLFINAAAGLIIYSPGPRLGYRWGKLITGVDIKTSPGATVQAKP